MTPSDQPRLPSPRHLAWGVALSFLLLVFFIRIWGLGITHADDAAWFLAARQGHTAIVSDFAFSQGRVWAFLSGTLLYASMYLQNTLAGELARHGPMLAFFVLFYVAAGLYLGARAAFMAALLNLALFTVRWEGSLAVTYPGVFWPLGCCFILAVLAGLRYRATGTRHWLRASVLLFFLSLFVHEGATLLFSLLFPLLALVPLRGESAREDSAERLRARQWLIAGLATAAVYAAIYLAWRLAFPTSYEGNMVGGADPARIPEVLLRLASAGTLVSDFFAPMSVTFTDAVSRDGIRVTYEPLAFILKPSSNLAAWMSMAVAAAAACSILWPSKDAAVGAPSRPGRLALFGLLAGAMIAALPILPVAAVEKYQRHFHELNVTSYVFTVLSHFGITLAAASVLMWLTGTLDRLARPAARAAALATAAGVGLCAYCSCQMNDMIVNDMRPEAARWKALDRAVTLDALGGFGMDSLYAPRFASGSWFAVLDPGYWTRFAAVVHNKRIALTGDLPSSASGGAHTALMDYSLERDGKQLAVVLAPLAIEADGRLSARQIALSLDRPDASDLQQFVLSYQDRKEGAVSRRFAELPSLDAFGGMRIVRDVSAMPGSIRLQRHSSVQSVPLRCDGQRVTGLTVTFGNSLRFDQGECLGGAFLGREWHPRERAGSWSRSRDASLSLPTTGLTGGRLEVNLKVASYVGLGFAGGKQDISLLLDDRVVAARTDTKGIGPQPLRAIIPAAAWSPGTPLRLTVRVDRTVRPGSTDTRELGVHLYEARISALP